MIDFVMHKENCSKHDAIERCKAMAGGEVSTAVAAATAPVPVTDLPRSAVLAKVFTYFANAVSMTRAAQDYLEARGLDYKLLATRGLSIGYNSGQMHHGERRDEDLIKACVEIGLMSESVSGRKSRTGGKQYQVFGRSCLAFALKGAGGEVEGMYFRNTTATDAHAGRHYYLRDRRGLYPGYPATDTRRLLITESVIDAVSLLQNESTAAGWAVLAMYGTNGFTKEHEAAVVALGALDEVCLFLNGDAAGRKATESVAARISALKPGVAISAVPVPEGEDCNTILIGHGPELLAHLIEERVAVVAAAMPGMEVFSSREAPQGTDLQSLVSAEAAAPPPTTQVLANPKDRVSKAQTTHTLLDTSNAYDLGYRARSSELRVKGLRCDHLDSLKVTLQIRLA